MPWDITAGRARLCASVKSDAALPSSTGCHQEKVSGWQPWTGFSSLPTPFHFPHITPLQCIFGLGETLLVFSKALISFREKSAEPFPSTQLQVPRRVRETLWSASQCEPPQRREIKEPERWSSWPRSPLLPFFVRAKFPMLFFFLLTMHNFCLGYPFSGWKCGNFEQKFILAELLEKNSEKYFCK